MQYLSSTKISWLVLFRKTVTVYSRKKHFVDTKCGICYFLSSFILAEFVSVWEFQFSWQLTMWIIRERLQVGVARILYQHFAGTCCLDHKGLQRPQSLCTSSLKVERIGSSEKLVPTVEWPKRPLKMLTNISVSAVCLKQSCCTS